MNSFFASLQEALGSQLFAGGLALTCVTALMALCRRVPFTLWNWIRLRASVTVEVMNSDPAYGWIEEWLDAHPYSKRATRLTVSTKAALGEDAARPVIFTPAPGNHFFVYKRRLVWLNRERNVGSAGDKGDEGLSLRQRETMTIRIIGRGQHVVRQLVEDARAAAMRATRKQSELYVSTMWYWNKIGAIAPRPLATVVLPDGMAERITADVTEFLESRAWYTERGIPYRRGYLFEGVPGSGKSSLIRALASSLNLNLYMLNIGSAGMTDEKLSMLMSEVKDDSIVLLEDVDAAVNRPQAAPAAASEGAMAVATAAPQGITFSGLLNALDGVNAREGVMVFMTTNHKERLDPALIRPGRVDVQEHFTNASPRQAARLFSHFFPGHTPGLQTAFASCVPPFGLSMAALQQHLLNHKRDPEGAARAAACFGAAPADA
jgi:mitochondrial chaperone BCS1